MYTNIYLYVYVYKYEIYKPIHKKVVVRLSFSELALPAFGGGVVCFADDGDGAKCCLMRMQKLSNDVCA